MQDLQDLQNLQKQIKHLDDQVTAVEADIRSLDGKIKNRIEADRSLIQKEISSLEERLQYLRRLFGACLSESLKAAHEADALEQSELLRVSAVEYFKRTNVDSELWKNIEF